MKNLTTLTLVMILTACGTPQVKPETTHIENEPAPRQYFAGDPQESAIINTNRKTQNVSEKHGKQLKLAMSYLQPATGTPLPDKALSVLQSLAQEELNDLETAFLYQTSGYAYTAKQDYQKAIEQFNLMLKKREFISTASEASVTKTLAFLHQALGESHVALALMFKWSALAENISGAEYYQVSRLQESTGDIKNAIINARKAMKLASTSSSQNHYLYAEHLANLHEKNNDPAQANALREQLQLNDTRSDTSKVLPILKVPPVYPIEALTQKLQGHCIVTFTVTESGNVDDVHVKPGDCKNLQGETADVFAQASIDAVKQFKYRPKYENGKPVKFMNMKNKISFLVAE